MDDRPPQRRGEPVVQRVLDATIDLLAEVGYDRLTVPEVADRAGLNKTSVYRRWPTKQALVGAALGRSLGHDAPLPDTGSLATDMVAMMTAAAQWAETPVGRGVARMLARDVDPEVREVSRSLMARHAAGPVTLFRRACARGEIPDSADVELALLVIAGALAQRGLVEEGPADPAFIERLARFVVAGLRAPAR
jgi:AcrR family transcriptional regulator